MYDLAEQIKKDFYGNQVDSTRVDFTLSATF